MHIAVNLITNSKSYMWDAGFESLVLRPYRCISKMTVSMTMYKRIIECNETFFVLSYYIRITEINKCSHLVCI